MDDMKSENMQEWINRLTEPRELDTAFTGVTPQNLSLGPGLVHLVINLCEELAYSPEVEFTALDTFDRYWAGYSQGIIAAQADAMKQPVSNIERTIITTQLWTQQLNKIQQDVLLKLLTVLTISAKFIGNGNRRRDRSHKIKMIADFLMNSKLRMPSLQEILATEAEITLALGHMRSSTVYAAVQTFIFVGSEKLKIENISVEDLGRLSEMLLRVVYAERKQIELKAVEKQCVEGVEKMTAINSSVLTGVGCNLLAAAVVLCGLVRVTGNMELCMDYGKIMAKTIESVEELHLQKAMVLTEIINEAMQTDDGADHNAAAANDVQGKKYLKYS